MMQKFHQVAKFSPFPLLPFLIPPKKYSKAFRKENFESKKKSTNLRRKRIVSWKNNNKTWQRYLQGEKTFDETTNKKKWRFQLLVFQNLSVKSSFFPPLLSKWKKISSNENNIIKFNSSAELSSKYKSRSWEEFNNCNFYICYGVPCEIYLFLKWNIDSVFVYVATDSSFKESFEASVGLNTSGLCDIRGKFERTFHFWGQQRNSICVAIEQERCRFIEHIAATINVHIIGYIFPTKYLYWKWFPCSISSITTHFLILYLTIRRYLVSAMVIWLLLHY